MQRIAVDTLDNRSALAYMGTGYDVVVIPQSSGYGSVVLVSPAYVAFAALHGGSVLETDGDADFTAFHFPGTGHATFNLLEQAWLNLQQPV